VIASAGSDVSPIDTVVTALWVMLPAYVPNNAAVLVGGGRPIDGGRTWRGRRLLGDGKTWRGTIAGILAGVVLALALRVLATYLARAHGIDLPAFPSLAMVSLPAGAMAGDVVASFLKRRLDRQRGAPMPGLDQLDFVVGALLLTALVTPRWFGATFTVPVVVVVVVLTPVLHVGTNALGYWLGLKNEPW
jgi:CDP-2,3-bis-(O-geranylgeranyl)-sn-glycerol synthase